MKSDPAVIRVALKYCGGCNPGYDRVSVAESIRDRLQGRVEFLAALDCNDIDIVLVLAGCETACADLSAFEDCETIVIQSVGDADRKVAAILQRLSQGQSAVE